MSEPKSKQTSVEWLFSQIPFEFSSSRAAYEALKQALELHKQEITQTWKDAHIHYVYGKEVGNVISDKPTSMSEQYYFTKFDREESL